MKSLSLVLNIVLTVAVVVLFALHFNGKKKGVDDVPDAAIAAANTNLRIAYFNSDTLMERYELYKLERTNLENDSKAAQSRMENEQRQFEKEVNEFQQRGQYLTITDKEAKEQRLGRKQQELQQLQQNLSNDLMKKEADVSQRVYGKIEEFLKGYSAKNKFTYVLAYQRGGGIWYADSTLDITQDVLKKLNEEYTTKKAE